MVRPTVRDEQTDLQPGKQTHGERGWSRPAGRMEASGAERMKKGDRIY